MVELTRFNACVAKQASGFLYVENARTLYLTGSDQIGLLWALAVCIASHLQNATLMQANVIVEVEEVKRPFAGDLGVFSKPEVGIFV